MTRARVAGLMSSWLLSTFDTVVIDTPRSLAIRFIVVEAIGLYRYSNWTFTGSTQYHSYSSAFGRFFKMIAASGLAM